MSEKRSEKEQRDRSCEMARLCEDEERYDDMVKIMDELVKDASSPLYKEERSLLSVAFRNAVSMRRDSWRELNAREQEEKDADSKTACQDMKNKMETEVRELCEEIINLINNYLLKKRLDSQWVVYYVKMKADYLRYMVETSGDPSTKASRTEKAKTTYEDAMKLAKNKLQCTNPIILGLALNFSAFLYEIMGDPDGACKMAKEAFDKGISDLYKVPEDFFIDSSRLLEHMRDNLRFWTAEQQDKQDKIVEQNTK